MEAVECLDKECSALGGLFQQVVNDMKSGVPHYEDFVNKAAKLHSHLKSTLFVLGAFLDSFQKIADAATNTKGSTRDIGACLTRIVLRHKSMESKLKTLCSALLECMVLPLQDKLEDWKKSAIQLDKDHAKEYKKLRSDIKKKSEAVQRAHKKQKKSKSGNEQAQHSKALDSTLLELTKNLNILQDTEKSACRKALIEQRSRYCMFVTALRPVLDEESGMVTDFQQLEEINKKLSKCTDEPYQLPPATEQMINDMKADGFTFQTPPSSPSSLGSRKSSMCSISSAGSSTNGSPHHQLGQNNHHQFHHHNNKGSSSGIGQRPGPNPLRLSSVSSQDSGFTSQDTLFLRPGSPKRLPSNCSTAVDQGERPHTISTAYEKGHQRPQLQPYTFSPPESTLTIHECSDETNLVENNGGIQPMCGNMVNNSNGHVAINNGSGPPPPNNPTNNSNKKPPVPQRLGQLSQEHRPIIPSKTMAATMAAAKQQQLQMLQQQQQQNNSSGSTMPNFTNMKNDMVVPQPVYMNMNDLKVLAAQKAEMSAVEFQNLPPDQEQEDSPELKTPTAESNGIMVPEVQKAGSGLPYSNTAAITHSHIDTHPSNSVSLKNSISQAGGDGSSSTSESSLGSSSGYGSQNTVRLPEDNNQQQLNNSHQPTLTAVHDGNIMARYVPFLSPIRLLVNLHKGFMPLPAPLLDDSKYRTASSHHLMSHTNSTTTTNSNKTRPYSQGMLTSFEIGIAPSDTLCVVPHQGSHQSSNVATLRRAQHHHMKPAPPARRTSSVMSDPAPTPDSNSTTPRSSLEHLPPPPPHLLHSDDDDPPPPPPPGGPTGGHPGETIFAQRTRSVAESVKALQKSGHMPCSPKNLRRAHSMVGPGPPAGIGGSSPRPSPGPGPIINEQIYAPVAHLQQKIQQRHAHQNNQQISPEEYGFGMAFHHSQNQFYQQMVDGTGLLMQSPQELQQGYGTANHDQLMKNMDTKLRLRPGPPQQHQLQQQPPYQRSISSPNYDAQTALRVRRWIESKSVTNVADCRPYLNQEIQQGLALRKTTSMNDRSAPRF